jgi:hypothetical protein
MTPPIRAPTIDFLETASVRDVRRWRESEIIHGRVSMLAALGFVVGENLEDFPAFYVSNLWSPQCLAQHDVGELYPWQSQPPFLPFT